MAILKLPLNRSRCGKSQKKNISESPFGHRLAPGATGGASGWGLRAREPTASGRPQPLPVPEEGGAC